MSGGIDRAIYITNFPIIGRVLSLEVGPDDFAAIKISRRDNAELLVLKKFSDHDDAMNYYRGQLRILESAEEYETTRYAFKMLDSIEG